MSLRTRLLTAIFLALLISFSVGAGLAVWQAARSVYAEQSGALANAQASAAASLANLPPGPQAATGLLRIVGALDGSRHLRGTLLAADGRVLASSQPAAAASTPAWLLHLIAPSLKPLTLKVPSAQEGTDAQEGPDALRLSSEPFNEVAERWAELRGRVAAFGFFFVLAAVLCSLTAARSLRPLTLLAQAMARVGRGELAPSLPETGPRETTTLARAFNAMAAALRAAQMQNRQLARQIVTIAEEERAEIARDLHDEVGPLLFAITTFTAAIGRQVQTGDLAPVGAQLEAIQSAVARVQSEVRDMLGRLREGGIAPVDLGTALQELVAFWRTVRPETRFALDLALPPELLSDAMRECLFRAAQEGISNAIRHGAPRHVRVAGSVQGAWIALCIADDGAGGEENAGLGLAGMRARAAALGGGVEIGRGAGWSVRVSLPFAAASLSQEVGR